jgi:hypothetical protein
MDGTRAAHGARDRVLAAEGRWVCGRYGPHHLLEGIGRYVRRAAPGREEELLRAIRARADELAEADGDLAVDGPSEGILRLSAVVLAAYEVLLPLFDGDARRTHAYLRRQVGTLLKRPLELSMSVIGQREDPLETFDAASRAGVAMYGTYFRFAFERPDPDTVQIRVGRCLFRDFFARHDAVPVTTVMCAWDKGWMAEIDPAESGLRAERTSLMSLGDDACRFRVLRTDDPLAVHTDALDRADA